MSKSYVEVLKEKQRLQAVITKDTKYIDWLTNFLIAGEKIEYDEAVESKFVSKTDKEQLRKFPVFLDAVIKHFEHYYIDYAGKTNYQEEFRVGYGDFVIIMTVIGGQGTSFTINKLYKKDATASVEFDEIMRSLPPKDYDEKCKAIKDLQNSVAVLEKLGFVKDGLTRFF